MDELNEVLRGMMTPELRRRVNSPTPSTADDPPASDARPRLGLNRQPPPGLPTRSERLGSDGTDSCQKCGGAGFLLDDLPVGHPDFGKPVPCQCKLNDRRARGRSRFQGVNDLESLARFTFESFEPELSWLPPDKRANLVRAYAAALAFAEQPDGWLLLTGGYGCGKTHLAAAIANQRLEEGQSAIFVVVPDLLDHLRTTFGPNSEASYDQLFDEVRNTSLLILDDLGVQSATPWAQEKLFQILNHRYNGQLPTVLSTNQRMEDLDQRLRSRLQDMNLVQHIQIRAPDYRAGAGPGQGDLSTLSFHAGQTFETFELQRRNASPDELSSLRRARQAAEAFADNPRGWFVLIGPSGSGKTHLAAAISNAWRALGQHDIMFVVTPDLLDHLRATFNPQSPVSYDRRFDELKRTPLLVLDDLGTESATPWAKEKLFQLLNYRHTAMLPTIITTSVSQDMLEPRLRNRVLDTARCQVWNLKAPSYRGSADQSAALLKADKPKPRYYSG